MHLQDNTMNFLRKLFRVKSADNVNKRRKGILEKVADDSDEEDEDQYAYTNQKEEMKLLEAKFGSDSEAHIPFIKKHLLPKDDNLQYLGHGGFSVVKKCYSLKYDSTVALKIIILKDEENNNSYLKKFLPKELEIWEEISKGQHPHLLNMIDKLKSESYMYIVMDFAENGDVFQLMLRGTLTEHKARTTFRGLAAAVSYLHGLGIAHRDIKPENLLLAKKDTVKLADFTFVTRDNPVSSERCGTPGFLAPEQRDCGYFDPFKSDMWQVGLTLYYMLFRAAPFTSSRKKHLLIEIEDCKNKYGNVPMATNRMLSSDAKDILAGLLQLEVAERWNIQQVNESFWLSPLSANK